MINYIRFNLSRFRLQIVLCLLLSISTNCGDTDSKEPGNSSIPDIAINEDIANKLKELEGRGALTDKSNPVPPEDVISTFNVSDDIDLELVLSEPKKDSIFLTVARKMN